MLDLWTVHLLDLPRHKCLFSSYTLAFFSHMRTCLLMNAVERCNCFVCLDCLSFFSLRSVQPKHIDTSVCLLIFLVGRNKLRLVFGCHIFASVSCRGRLAWFMCVHPCVCEDVELFVQIVVESIDRQFPQRKVEWTNIRFIRSGPKVQQNTQMSCFLSCCEKQTFRLQALVYCHCMVL